MHISDAPSSNRAGWQGRAPRSSRQKQVVFMYVFLCIFSRSGLSAVVYAATKDLLMRVPDGSKIRIISLMEPDNSIGSVDEKNL